MSNLSPFVLVPVLSVRCRAVFIPSTYLQRAVVSPSLLVGSLYLDCVKEINRFTESHQPLPCASAQNSLRCSKRRFSPELGTSASGVAASSSDAFHVVDFTVYFHTNCLVK